MTEGETVDGVAAFLRRLAAREDEKSAALRAAWRLSDATNAAMIAMSLRAAAEDIEAGAYALQGKGSEP